jgi:hypothetical protein
MFEVPSKQKNLYPINEKLVSSKSQALLKHQTYNLQTLIINKLVKIYSYTTNVQ